jgi:hypothetical protein
MLAAQHETNITRHRILSEFTLKMLKLERIEEAVTVSEFIELLCAKAKEFTMLLSARHARTVANLPGPKRGRTKGA